MSLRHRVVNAFIQCRTCLRKCWAVLSECRAVLSECRAVLRGFRAYVCRCLRTCSRVENDRS